MVEFQNSESHRPSSGSIVLVFVVILVLIVAIIVWAMFIHVGRLVVEGEYPFVVTVGGATRICENGDTCTFSLSPKEYSVVISKDGYYEQALQSTVVRGESVSVSVDFSVIPFLEPYSGVFESLVLEPLEEWGKVVSFDLRGDRGIYFSSAEAGLQLYEWKDGESFNVVQFESLVSPVVVLGSLHAAVLDEGRLFVVDLVKKRRMRMFEGSVLVRSASFNLSGELLLLDIEENGIPGLVVWDTVVSELTRFAWYEKSDLLVWSRSEDRAFFVLTNQPVSVETAFGSLSDFGSLLDASYRLYRVVLSDDVKANVVQDFRTTGILPERMGYSSDELLIEGKDGKVWRMVL